MSDMLNIGRSGSLAMKAALTVTSENVANADTEGYSRRTITTAEVTGGSTDPFYNSSTGQGVLIKDVNRAFDALVIQKVRQSHSALTSADTMLPAMKQLEDRLLPDAGGVTEMLDAYFETLEGLSALPSDAGMRTVLLEASGGLASAVDDMATDVEDLGDYLHAQGTQIADRINNLLKEVDVINQSIGRTSVPGADNAALDRRDAMLNDLSKLIEINVSYSDNNIATVRLGDSPLGTPLVDGTGAARVSVNRDLSVSVRPARAGADPSETVTRWPSGGRLHGLTTSLSAVTATLTDLNDWAQTFADQMNTIHVAARDENGVAGGKMFTLNGWDAQPAAANQGTALASATEILGETVPDGNIRLVRDEAAGQWHAYDEAGTLLGSGTNRIDIEGVEIEITGNGAEGDVILLEATHGQAKNMRFLLTEPEQFAAGGSVTITPEPANTGTAVLTTQPNPVSHNYVPTVASLLPTTGEAVELLSAGVVGLIPADSSDLTLASLSTGGGTPSDIMVFTREGTQIAGPSLTTAEASVLMTAANGFAPGAVYDGSMTGQASNYLGSTLATDGSDANTNWLRLSNLPNEDLIVVAGAGALEIGGSVTQGDGVTPDPGPVTLEVVDGATGEMRLLDQATGHRLGGGFLNADGEVAIAGQTYRLAGTPATGDRFDVAIGTNGTGDARGLKALAGLRGFDSSTGLGGYQSFLTEIRTEVGSVVAATERRQEVAEAQNEAALTAQNAASGVDLDTEAAQLLKYQQAFQANARVMTVAREIFDTLLQSL